MLNKKLGRPQTKTKNVDFVQFYGLKAGKEKSKDNKLLSAY